jgi:hypothetical protein
MTHQNTKFIDVHDPKHLITGPKKEKVIAIFNQRGIGILHADDEETMEVHSWREVASFGATMHKAADDTFAFRCNSGDEEQIIALVTEAAVVMNAAALKYTRMWEGEDFEPIKFPSTYTPGEVSDEVK